MNPPPRRYHRGSVLGRMVRFFADNPHEELSIEDVCTKFDTTPATAASRVAEAIRDGVLERVVVYRRAPGAPAAAFTAEESNP